MLSPFRRRLESRRTGKPGSGDVGQLEEMIHDVGGFERLLFDLVHHGEIDLVLGANRGQGNSQKCQQDTWVHNARENQECHGR